MNTRLGIPPFKIRTIVRETKLTLSVSFPLALFLPLCAFAESQSVVSSVVREWENVTPEQRERYRNREEEFSSERGREGDSMKEDGDGRG